jgi:hypothetical protein
MDVFMRQPFGFSGRYNGQVSDTINLERKFKEEDLMDVSHHRHDKARGELLY